MKKYGGRKSRDTLPLNRFVFHLPIKGAGARSRPEILAPTSEARAPQHCFRVTRVFTKVHLFKDY